MKRLYPTIVFLLALFISPGVFAQVNLKSINTAYQQLFDSLGTGATNDITTLPKGWAFAETGTNANTTYAGGNGSSNTGNTYSFGTNGSTERSLGGLQSGSLIPIIGAKFVNNTGSTVTSLQISFTGEQWRLGTTARGADRLDFQYSLDAATLNSGTWTHVDQLDFNSPITIGTVGALNGNIAPNNTVVTFEITGLNIASGSTFSIRWLDFNVASSDDGLAVDNFTLTPVGVPANQPRIILNPETLNFGDVNVNASATLAYEVVGSNLTDSITASVANPYFTLSTDGVNFSSSVSVSDSSLVYVRFAPLANGPIMDSIFHFSNSTFASMVVKGSGFDQASNVIPIASARTKSVGTKVTVAGRITVANEQGSPAYIQDATGGIPVFDFALSNGVEIGDSVLVTGPIGLFNAQVQISGSGIFFTLADSSKRFIEPKNINISDLAANEGLLVTVQGVELVDKSFVFYPQSTERMTNGSTQADLRIDGDTNIPGLTKPQGIVDITGVVGRFKTSAQLLPRFRQDIPGAADPSTPFDSIPKAKTFDVVDWNFEFFGARSEDYKNQEFGPADEALQLENIKSVLLSLNADIIAVQEVSDQSLFATLVSQLGSHAYTCSDRFSHSFEGPSDDFPPQKVCFIYDTTTVDVLSARPMFEALYDSARNIDPSKLPGIPGGASSFYSSGRLPYLLTANVTIEGVTETVKLITIHAKSGATADDRNRRLYDAAVLKDSLDAHFANDQVIVLGDLNDDLDQSIVSGLSSPYAAFVNDTANYVTVTKALSDAGARSTVSFSDVIDHQILTNELQEEFLSGSQRVITPFQMIFNYANTTSDHLPVITRYAFIAPEVNFAQQAAALSEDSTIFVVSLSLSKSLTVASQLTLSIDGTASAGNDFTTSPPTTGNTLVLDLPAGSNNASFIITVANDSTDELEENAFFTIASDAGITVGNASVFSLTIQDNDVPSISFATESASAEEGSGAFTVTLSLSAAPATGQTATILVTDGFKVNYGADYTTSPAPDQNLITLSIPAGSNEASFTITPLADMKHEVPTETIAFTLQNASEGLITDAPLSSSFTIIDVKKRPALSTLVVFPNPTAGEVQLSFEGGDFQGTLHAELRKPNGGLLYSGTGTLTELSNALSNKLKYEHKGIYILTLNVDDETSVIRILKKD